VGALDHGFEQELSLPCQLEVLHYWLGLRNGRLMPSREDFRPARVVKRLPLVSLVDIVSDVAGDGPAFRFRLAGTGLRDMIGRELTGTFFSSLPEYWSDMTRRVIETRTPQHGFQSLAWAGKPFVIQAWLRLPLSTDGETVNMVLGYDRFITVQKPEGAQVYRPGDGPSGFAAAAG
jgi:hypothetical protein